MDRVILIKKRNMLIVRSFDFKNDTYEQFQGPGRLDNAIEFIREKKLTLIFPKELITEVEEQV